MLKIITIKICTVVSGTSAKNDDYMYYRKGRGRESESYDINYHKRKS